MKQYSGQVIYLGLDVHKKSYAVTAMSDGVCIKKDTLKACPSQLVSYCCKFFPGAEIRTAYEAGFCGFHLHRRLVSEGIQNMVVHPASIEVEARNRVKTDKRDSQKIAAQLALGRLSGIYIPKQEREDFRSISRLRENLMKERIRIGNTLKSFLYLQGAIRFDDTTRVSMKWIQNLLKKEFSADVKFTIDTYVKTWMQLSDSIKNVEGKLKLQALDDRELEEIYTSVPGIGPTAARILINELDDMSQFPNEGKVFSYVGLTPCEHSSGEHRHLGHISRQGKSSLRKILIQCAWVAIRHDHSLAVVFEELKPRIGSRRAIVAVARKLIGRVYSCLKGRRKYVNITKDGELVTQKSSDPKDVE